MWKENLRKWLTEPSTYMAIVTLGFVVTNTLWGREAQRRTLSAYVTVAELQFKVEMEKGKEYRRYFPVIENTGSTPVRNARFWIGQKIHEGSFSTAPSEPSSFEMSSLVPTHLSLGPKSKIGEAGSGFGLAASSVELLKSGKIAAYMYGRIEYSDVFDVQHTTNFCFIVSRITQRTSPEDIPPRSCSGNSNCTDEECNK